MMKTLAPVLFVLLFVPTVLAQNDDALLDASAFDQSVVQAKENHPKLTWLYGLNLFSDNSLILPVSQPQASALAAFRGKAFVKADQEGTGQFYVSSVFNHYLLASSSDPTVAKSFQAFQPDPEHPNIQLSEAHFSFDIQKAVYLRVGNQLLSWGASRVWNPADFVNFQPQNSQIPIDLRTGKPGVRVHVPWERANLFFFADFSGSVQNGQVQDYGRSAAAHWRADATFAGFNWGLVGTAGKETPVKSGATLSGRLGGIDWWGEYGATLPVNSFTAAWGASFGGEKTFGDEKEISLSAEVYRLDQVKDDLWVKLAHSKLLGADIGGSLELFTNLDDQTAQTTAALDFSLSRLPPFTVYARVNCGPGSGEFTALAGRTFATLGLRSLISF